MNFSNRDAMQSRLGAVVIMLAACGIGGPQEGARIVAGDACAIEVELVAALEGDHVNRSGIGLLTEDEILLVSNVDLSQIEVFDHQGRFLRSVGHRGEGPGEFIGVYELKGLAGGRIAAIDARATRITYLNQDLSLQKVLRIPVMIYPHGAIPLVDGGWLLSGVSTDRASFGSAVVEVDSAGIPRRFFGDNETVKEGPARGMMPTRLLAYHPSVGVVTMQTIDYAIELWSRDGPLTEVIRPASDWFHWPPQGFGAQRVEGPNVNAVGNRPPTDRVAGIQFDQEGRLWILSQITPDTWRDGLNEAGEIVDRARYADFMLQIYDVTKRASLCQVRLEDDFYFGGFAGPGILKTYSEDLAGNPSVTIQELHLR